MPMGQRGVKMIRNFDAFMNKFASGVSFLASIWIFVIMFFICFDVVSRLFFNDPLIGTPEIVQNSLASIAFLMLPWATFLGQHVRSTMIRDRLPRKMGYALDAIAFVFGILLFLGIAYASYAPAVRATRIRDFQGEGLRVPIYPVWWVLIFGAILSAYQCLAKIVRAILHIRGGHNVESLREHGGIQL
jgi:TRAP-type mannitol/chloroaromatic compound transport system permease small subunit